MNNPDKLAYMRYKDILQFDPTELIACGEDKLALAKYYRDHQQFCEDCFVFDSCLPKNHVTTDLKNAVSSMKLPLEQFNYPATLATCAFNTDYFTCPKLTPDQVNAFMGVDISFMQGNEPLRLNILNYLAGGTFESSKSFYDRFKAIGVTDFSNQYFLKHKCIKTHPNGKKEEVSYMNFFNKKPNEDVKIVERSEEEITEIMKISKAYQNELSNVFQKQFMGSTFHLNSKAKNFDLQAYENRIKPTIWQRLGRKTSQEYKDMMKAFKNYNDPNSKDYMNGAKLGKATEAYIQHKRDQGLDNFDKPESTRCKRLEFAYTIQDILKNMDMKEEEIRADIEAKFNEGYPSVYTNSINNAPQIDANNELQNQIQEDLKKDELPANSNEIKANENNNLELEDELEV